MTDISLLELLKEADEFYNQGQFAAAAETARSIILTIQSSQDQRSPQREFLLARAEHIVGQYGVASVLTSPGSVYREENSLTEAMQYLEEALALVAELYERQSQYNAHEELAKVYAALGSDKRALEHYVKFHELEKEVQSEEARKKAEYLDYSRKEAERERERVIAKSVADERLNSQQHLLERILPPDIATRLLQGEKIADYYPHISILFADIVGFTSISSHMPAHVVVKFLNHVFGVFDGIMKESGCEKIITIGDGYMAVAGAPVECADHAERITRAALAMQKDIHLTGDIREHIDEGTVFNIRIGIHTGSAVGGIIGDERFVYDVHGDAVNLTAHMESQGEAGRIHCSQEFAMHVQNRDGSGGMHSFFRFEERGEMEIKGKGMMRTYFLQRA